MTIDETFLHKMRNKEYGYTAPRTCITYKVDGLSFNEYKGNHMWPHLNTWPAVAD